MNPELCEPLLEALFAAGAVDAWFTPIVMKKSRPALTVAALCPPAAREAVAHGAPARVDDHRGALLDARRMVLPRRVVDGRDAVGQDAGQGRRRGRGGQHRARVRGVPAAGRRRRRSGQASVSGRTGCLLPSLIQSPSGNEPGPRANPHRRGRRRQRAAYLDELRAAGFTVDARGGVIEDAEGADLVLVAGGAEGSRRDGFGAVMDAIIAARNAAGAAAGDRLRTARLRRRAGADVIGASLASGADDVVVVPAARRRAARPHRRRLEDDRGAHGARALRALRRRARAPRRLGRPHPRHLRGAVGHRSAASAKRSAGPAPRCFLCTDEITSVMLVSASDDPQAMKVPIKLERYPEVRAGVRVARAGARRGRRRARRCSVRGPSWRRRRAGARSWPCRCSSSARSPARCFCATTSPRPPLGPRAIDFLRVAASMLGLVLQVGARLRGAARADAAHVDVALQRGAAHARARAVQGLLRGVDRRHGRPRRRRGRSSTSTAPPSR